MGAIEARDMDCAVELLSKHPCLPLGSQLEVRPVDEALDDRCGAANYTTRPLAEGIQIACLGYGDEANWNSMSDNERETMIEGCIAYNDVLAKYGEWIGGAALQGAATAKTLRWKRGKVMVTDGPYTETKEQLGGVATFKFRDMDQAIEAWSNHPCLRAGDVLELRPVDEKFNALVEARQHSFQARSAV